MKKVVAFLLFSLVGTLTYSQDSLLRAQARDPKKITEELTNKLVGEVFLHKGFKAADGTVLTETDLRGKVVFVNFWYANCLPCIAEMKGLNKFYDTLKDRKDFLFLSLTYDPDTVTKKVVDKYGVKYRVLNLSKLECKELSGGKGYPTSFILDRAGVIRWVKVGGDIDQDNAYSDILEIVYPEVLGILGQKPASASK